MPIFTRQRAREVNKAKVELALTQPKVKLDKVYPTSRKYCIKRKPVKSWKVKMIKELNKPVKPKPDKDHWLKKMFEGCDFKTISYEEKARKFWAKKRWRR